MRVAPAGFQVPGVAVTVVPTRGSPMIVGGIALPTGGGWGPSELSSASLPLVVAPPVTDTVVAVSRVHASSHHSLAYSLPYGASNFRRKSPVDSPPRS